MSEELIEQPKKKFNIYEFFHQYGPLIKRTFKRGYIALAIGAIGGIYGYLKENAKPISYDAVVTFILEEDLAGSGQTITPGNQFLLALSGQTMTSNKEMMLDLAKSNKLVEETLLRKIKVDKDSVLMVNYFASVMGYTTLSKPVVPNDYYLGKQTDIDKLLRIYSTNLLRNLNADVKKSGIIALAISFGDQVFAKYFLELHLETISDFYTKNRLVRLVNLVEIARKKRDSLQALLQNREFGLANMKDKEFGSVMNRARVPQLQIQRDIGTITAQYTESLAAYNSAKLDLEKKKPFIQIVNDIRLPLDGTGNEPVKKGIIMLVISSLVGIILVAGFLFIKDYLKEQKASFLESQKMIS